MFQYFALVKRPDVIRVLCVVVVERTRTARVMSFKAETLLQNGVCSYH